MEVTDDTILRGANRVQNIAFFLELETSVQILALLVCKGGARRQSIAFRSHDRSAKKRIRVTFCG